MLKFYQGVIFLMLFCTVQLRAQVSFIFIPELHGRTLDGLLQVRLANTGSQSQLVSLTVKVSAAGAGNIVSIKTPAFQLMPGTNSLPGGLIARSAIRFAENKVATICRQSGYFTEGDYEYCFELNAGDQSHQGETLGDQCFDYYLQPFSPLLLLNPAEEDKICNKRPPFFWQPLLPAVPGVQYRLVLTEVKPGQAKVEALNYNMPLINQLGINSPMLFYPSLAKDLVQGKTYVWQVSAYKNDMLLVNSEIWDFTVFCEEETAAEVPESFRDITDLTKGNFYVARGKVLFAVENVYDKAPLNYKIRCITRPELEMRKLPAIKLNRGNNHVIIPLAENRSFVDGYYYLLELKLPNGEEKQLRFLYKSETE
ncbi:hypothetical protein [Chitinophaga sp.]|uniref:hypothetical protein n=1 Tax=Chitinophaga sp. TaxID=1869181 RepID=UPI002C547AA6|nr:hypothetical protein [Chitinophaga sp.]HWV65699.1 hypothetical protein [Chitinophaga sp.]